MSENIGMFMVHNRISEIQMVSLDTMTVRIRGKKHKFR